MVITDDVYEMVKQKGPVIPSDVNKAINQNLMTTSAILSDLASRGKLKVSSLKCGGSPFYYCPGQEAMLTAFIHYLEEKDQRTYHLLREKGVIKDRDMNALTRFSLRQIKDFAIPLSVKHASGEDLFWKYAFFPDTEAETTIKAMFELPQGMSNPGMPSVVPEPPAQVLTPPQSMVGPLPQMLSPEPIKVLEDTPPQPPAADAERRLMEGKKVGRGAKVSREKQDDEFTDDVANYFKKNHITVESEQTLKKNSEFEYFVTVTSAIGELTYYCQAKNKKKLSDTDLNNVYLKAQHHKLPALLITNGELTKSAKEAQKELKGLIVKTL